MDGATQQRQRGPGGFPAPVWENPGGEHFWSWPEVADWIRDSLNLALEVTPEEIRVADAILKARQAETVARRALEAADEGMRRELGPLLDVA